MAKGSFPGCLRKKITKKRIRNLRHFGNNAKFEKNCRIALQILENLRRFEDVFGSSDEVWSGIDFGISISALSTYILCF